MAVVIATKVVVEKKALCVYSFVSTVCINKY